MNLNTLYKKITNWKYIIWLLIWFVWIINFCNAEFIWSFNCETTNKTCWQLNSPSCVWTYTVHFESTDNGAFSLRYWSHSHISETSRTITVDCWTPILVQWPFLSYPQANFTVNFWTDPNWWSCPECPTCPEVPECPEVNTWEILSWYILESEIDTNYCVLNWLCPNECWSWEELTGTNRSSLFINNIQYPWAPTIKFTIPEEIQREQNTDEEETNIDVIWYGYDQDKMQQMVNTQYYKPTAEEMSWLMEKVADFLPLVAVALLIIRIRRIVKKVF